MKCFLLLSLFSALHVAKPAKLAGQKSAIAFLTHSDNGGNKNKDTILQNDSCAHLTVSERVLAFAQTFIGTPYRFASSNPSHGFDCSGFVSYVFNNFNFAVPRSSAEFMNIGMKIKFADALPGDIILFTGTRVKKRSVGHIGIILSNNTNEVDFIHSTSGKEHGVTITKMDERYKQRFLQIIRLFNPAVVSPNSNIVY